MPGTQQEIQLLVAVARVDAQLNELRGELGRLPEQIKRTDAALANLESNEKAAASKLEEMGKERREIEQQLQDSAAQITKYKTQLMEVKTNKEYQAMLHEIEHLEKDIDAREERLLILMDELDHLSVLTYPSGRAVHYSPDALGRASQAMPYLSNVSYYPDGSLEKMVYANGRIADFTRTITNRLHTIHIDGLIDLDYQYDPAGNVTAIQDLLSPSYTLVMSYDG